MLAYSQPPPWAPRWGIRSGTCPTYSGYGEELTEAESAREAYYTERLARASEAAEEAAYQAHINAALAQQAHDFNQRIVVGFIGAGAVSVLMWALTQAVMGRK